MTVHRKEVTGSTNVDARSGAHGDVYAAEFQTAGRGRLDHRWESARACNLTFSAVFDVAGLQPADVATFPLVVGLSIAETVERVCPALADKPAVKWPNDVLVGGRKLAGILCERNGDCVIAGVGVNVNQREFSGELSSRATSLAMLCGREFDRDDVLRKILEDLYAAHERWREGGFAAFHAAFSKRDYLKGRVIAVRQTDADASPVTGLCSGVQADGTLLVGGTPVYAGEAHVGLPCGEGDIITSP